MAFMAKLGWRLLIEQNKLWAKVLSIKYIHGKVSPDKFLKKRRSSNAWQGIVVACPLINKGLKAKVYNEKETLFWRDKWLGDSPLLGFALTNISLPRSYKCVKDYWNHGLGWGWNVLHSLLPHQDLRRLDTTSIRADDNERDTTCWGLSNSGKFSLSSAYQALMPSATAVIEATWSRIWKLHIPQKMQQFIWLVYHKRILTNLERKQRRFMEDPSCPFCTEVNEDLDHLFRKCTKVILV